MGEVADIGCLVETVMVSNGNIDGAEVEAAQILKRKFDEAENPLGSTALTEVTCERCDATFVVQEDIPGRRAVLVFGERGEEGDDCDRDVTTRGATQGKSLININLINIERNSQREYKPEPKFDINPLAPNVDGTNYVMNRDRAEAMAYAEDDFQTKAAYNRALMREDAEFAERKAKIQGEFQEVTSALHGGMYPPTRKLGRKERKSLKRRESELLEQFSELTRDERGAEEQRLPNNVDERFTLAQVEEDMLKVGIKDFSPGLPEYMKPGARARFYERQASRIGEWAGVLHDRPLSAEFKKAHPGMQFQPKRLVRVENEAAALAKSIAIKEGTSYHTAQTAVSQAIEGPDTSGRRPEAERLLRRAADEKLDEEYAQITSEIRERAERLDDLHRRLVDTVEIQPIRDELAAKRKLLDEVRRAVGLAEDKEADDSRHSTEIVAE